MAILEGKGTVISLIDYISLKW